MPDMSVNELPGRPTLRSIVGLLMLPACYDGVGSVDSAEALLKGASVCEDTGWLSEATLDGVSAGDACSCEVTSAIDKWSVPPSDSPCAHSKDVGPGQCESDARNTWSRRCAIDAYVIACCEAAAEAGCPCGGEAP